MGDTDDGERSLARRDASPLATGDPYERQYMKGEGLVLYRAKQRTPWPMNALIGALALSSVIPAVLGLPGAWITAVTMLPVLFVVWALFAVLRVTVSEGNVNVQYGLFGPTIPMAAIESVTPTEYKWTTFGGWGIRRGPGGIWLYNMPGDGGRAVRIEWRDGKGRRRVTLIGSPNHVELAETISKARLALPGAAPAPALPEGQRALDDGE